MPEDTLLRRVRCAALAVATGLALGSVATAQDLDVPTASDQIALGGGAVIRGLDRVSGDSVDMTLERGGAARLGNLIVMLEECRYPVENPAAEAYAWIDIFDSRADEVLFSGWMIASSPALNALDHRRYDFWVLRCITS